MWFKVFYTSFLVPKNYHAQTRGPLIFIKPEYRQDLGLLAHELTHVKQWYKNPLFHAVRYKFSKSYRLSCELEAFKHQLSFYDIDHSNLFAGYLSSNYKLDITPTKALELLKSEYVGC